MSINDNQKEQDQNLEEMNYPASEDIFSREPHVPLSAEGLPLELENSEPMEMDLDVPGSELDDSQEAIGSEDEENNYWSIGGDNHEDLEESE